MNNGATKYHENRFYIHSVVDLCMSDGSGEYFQVSEGGDHVCGDN